MNTEDDIFYTPIEVSKILKVTRRYVYKMLEDGRLRGVRLGEGQNAGWRIPKSEINVIACKAYDKEC